MKPLIPLGILAWTCSIQAQDWPQWRGPNRDGVAGNIALPERWPERLNKSWELEVGEGHASPVVVGKHLYVFSRAKEHEVVRCVEAKSGKVLWEHSYAAPYKVDPAAAGHGPGPKATPTFHQGKLYTQGMSSQLRCFDAGDGKVIWEHDLLKKYDAVGPQFGTSASLLIEGDLVIALVGGWKKGAIVAFERETGKERWSTPCDGPAYCSPIAVDLTGVRQIITLTRGEFLALAPKDGRLLWRMEYATAYEQNSVTPVVWKDLVIISGYGKPTLAIRVKRDGDQFTTEEVWKNSRLRMYMSSPVVSGDYLYGHDQGGRMVCIELATGKTMWFGGSLGDYASIIRVGDRLLCLDDFAQLTVFAANPKELKVLASIRVSDSPTWAHLAISPGRLFVKDKTRLIGYELPK